MTKEQTKQTAEAVQQLGGERLAPLVVFHFLEVGARVAEHLTAEQIAEEVKKQKQKEKYAADRGFVYLTDSDFVGFILESVQKLAQMPAPVRNSIIKKYL